MKNKFKMPIIGDVEGSRVEYTIPKEISDRIPDYFYTALAGELFSVFGWERAKDAFYSEEDDSVCDLDSSTGGWAEAFYATCTKLDMQWLAEYYNTLEWYDSDIFDGIIEAEIGQRFMKKEETGANSYYRYLCQRRAADKDSKQKKDQG